LAPTFCAAHRRWQEASRPVQDPDLDSLRLRNPLQGYHWLELVRQSCMTSRSATRRFRAWHSCPERELLPFRPLLQHRRLDGKPPVQGLLERDSRSGSRSSVHCSDGGCRPPFGRGPPPRPHRRAGAVDGRHKNDNPDGRPGGSPVEGHAERNDSRCPSGSGTGV